jgi:hypothetical protein
MTFPRELTPAEQATVNNFAATRMDFKQVFLLTPFVIETTQPSHAPHARPAQAALEPFSYFGWACGDRTLQEYPNSAEQVIDLLRRQTGMQYETAEPDAPDAKFMLWGEKRHVSHISVRLTYSELLRRRKAAFADLVVNLHQYEKLGIGNPFWSSAIGYGFGVIAHPPRWFNGGDFGHYIASLRRKPLPSPFTT